MFNKTINRIKNIIMNNKCLTLVILIWIVFIIVLPVSIVPKIFAIAAGLNFYIFTIYFGNFFNIASLFMSLFLFMIGCSQVKMTPIEQNDFSLMTWLTLFAVIIPFYVTMFIYIKLSNKRNKLPLCVKESKLNDRTILLTNIIMLIVEIIIYTFALIKLGDIPLFNDYLRANIMTGVLGNWLMTIMVLPGILIIFDVVYIVRTRKYQYFAFIIIFIAMIMLLGGRINVFIPIVTAIFYLIIELYYNEKSKKHLIAIGGLLLVIVTVLMLIIPLLRTSVYSGSGTEFYEVIYAEDENETEPSASTEDTTESTLKLPAVLKPIWVNLSTELHGFDWLVEKLSETGEFQYGRMFLRGPLNFIFKYFVDSPDADLLTYSWLNVLTFMQKPYMDFGIIGVAVFIIIYTFFGMYLYNKVLQKKSMFLILYYSYYCMATLFFVFDNHFLYTTFIVNTILLFIFTRGLSVDWITLGHSFLRRLINKGSMNNKEKD